MSEEIESESKLLSGLEKAQQRRREMAEQGISIVRMAPGEKSKSNPQSLRLAITANCWDCMGGEHAENVRQQVRECAVEKCFLYAVRPWQIKDITGGNTGE